MGLVNVPDQSLPPCPRSFAEPIDPAHQLHVRLQDVVHDATPCDEDGEPISPGLAAVNAAVVYGQVTAKMRLFVDTVGFDRHGQNTVVEAWYFRCGVCGFVLPASRLAGVP